MEEIYSKLPKDIKQDYKIKDKFTRQNDKVSITHKLCNHSYTTTFSKLLRNYGKCPICVGGHHTEDSFSNFVRKVTCGEYEYVCCFKSMSNYCEVKHNMCEHTYKVKPSKFKLGQRCPNCNTCVNSKMSKDVEQILKSFKLEYKKEFTFDDLKSTNKLRFDFAVFKNYVLFMLIEVDGEQHFKPIKRFGGSNGYLKTIKNDELKNKYCQGNKIKLIRINNKNKGIMYDYLKSILDFNFYTNDVDYILESNYYEVYNIRVIYTETDKSSDDIAKIFNKSKPTILSILHYDNYGNIAKELQETIKNKLTNNKRKREPLFSQEQILEMRKMHNEKISYRKIAIVFNTNHNTIIRYLNNFKTI